MHVTRTIPAVLTATALVLTSCSSTEGGIGAPAALETNGDEVIQDADGTGAEVSQRLFESSETVVVSAKERDQQLKAAPLRSSSGRRCSCVSTAPMPPSTPKSGASVPRA